MDFDDNFVGHGNDWDWQLDGILSRMVTLQKLTISSGKPGLEVASKKNLEDRHRLLSKTGIFQLLGQVELVICSTQTDALKHPRMLTQTLYTWRCLKGEQKLRQEPTTRKVYADSRLLSEGVVQDVEEMYVPW